MLNFCIVPIEFAEPADYDKIKPDDLLQIDNLLKAVKAGDKIKITEKNGKYEFVGKLVLSNRDKEILLSAGLLNFTRKHS